MGDEVKACNLTQYTIPPKAASVVKYVENFAKDIGDNGGYSFTNYLSMTYNIINEDYSYANETPGVITTAELDAYKEKIIGWIEDRKSTASDYETNAHSLNENQEWEVTRITEAMVLADLNQGIYEVQKFDLCLLAGLVEASKDVLK